MQYTFAKLPRGILFQIVIFRKEYFIYIDKIVFFLKYIIGLIYCRLSGNTVLNNPIILGQIPKILSDIFPIQLYHYSPPQYLLNYYLYILVLVIGIMYIALSQPDSSLRELHRSVQLLTSPHTRTLCTLCRSVNSRYYAPFRKCDGAGTERNGAGTEHSGAEDRSISVEWIKGNSYLSTHLSLSIPLWFW